MTSALENLSPAQQQHVRERVRTLLGRSEAFQRLPPDERRSMARALVDTVAYLADPKAGQRTAEALADQTGQTPPRQAGQPIDAKKLEPQPEIGAAAEAGTKAFEELTSAVDFPKFVAGLVDGVFNAIVTASIRQMEAYQTLLENVVKSVDQFAKDNFTLNQGRDYLADRFPSLLKIDTSMGQPRLGLTDDGEEQGLGEVGKALGMEGELDLEDEASEAELARRAQLEMAKLRQKQLATMVLMGINRIVVTNGLINAKVVVDVKTKASAQTSATSASSFDEKTTAFESKGGGWFSSGARSQVSNTVVKSATEDTATSEQSVETKAALTGEVKINFKSETYPLDKLASQTELEAVTQRSK
jgi:hypothetical protein